MISALPGRGKKGVLRKKLRASQTYEVRILSHVLPCLTSVKEWKAAARELDEYLHFDEWKKVDEDPYYDWRLIRKVSRSLRTLREKNDARGCLGVLETCIRANFAGIESSRSALTPSLYPCYSTLSTDCTARFVLVIASIYLCIDPFIQDLFGHQRSS